MKHILTILWLVALAVGVQAQDQAARTVVRNYERSAKNIFNVRDFGASGDGVNADGPAIQAAIYACGLAGGGTVFFPQGTYNVTSLPFTNAPAYGPWPATTIGGGNGVCQLHVPILDLYTNSTITIEFVGVAAAAPNLNWLNGGATITTNGSIILSQRTDGHGYESIFGDTQPPGSSWQFNNVNLAFRNLIIRTTNNPTFHALRLRWTAMASVENCQVDVGVRLDQITQPATDTAGITMPFQYNWGISRVRNVDVIGYNKGIIFSEHSDIDDVRIWLCNQAFYPVTADHGSRIGKTLVVGCQYGIWTDMNGTSQFANLRWEHYCAEHTGGANVSGRLWTTNLFDLYDPNSSLRGTLNFTTVESAVGATNAYKTTGGTNFATTCLVDHVAPNNSAFVYTSAAVIICTNTSTYTDTPLQVKLAPGLWQVRYHSEAWSSGFATAGSKIQFAFSGTATEKGGNAQWGNQAAAHADNVALNTRNSAYMGLNLGGGDLVTAAGQSTAVSGTSLLNVTVTGTLKIQMAQVAAISAQTITLATGGYIVATRLQ